MFDLYEKVKKIIEADNIEEAKQLLYGHDSINITGYYENIISTFIQKKESILPKVGNCIVYDIEKDINDLIDILFISNYIQNEWIKERKEINKLRSTLKAKYKRETDIIRKTELKTRLNQLSEESQRINQYFQSLNSKNMVIKKETELFGTDYKNEIEKLKIACNIIHTVRNGLSHRNKELSIGKEIKIDNKVKISIPIDYIDGFNKGSIKVKEEDRELLIQTNETAFSLIKALDYNPIKIDSFFHNVRPDILSYILNTFNNNMEIISNLPANLFFLNPKDLVQTLDFALYTRIDIKTLNNIINRSRKVSFSKVINTYNLMIEEGIEIGFFDNVAKNSFFNTGDIKRIIKVFEKEKIDKKYLSYLEPDGNFNIEKITTILHYLKKENIDLNILEYLKNDAYRQPENTIKVLKYMKNNDIDYNILKNTLVNNNNNQNPPFFIGDKKLAPIQHTFFDNPDSTIELLNYIKTHNIDFSIMQYMTETRIDNPTAAFKIIDYLTKENIDYKILDNMKRIINREETISILKELQRENIDLKNIHYFDRVYMNCDKKQASEIIASTKELLLFFNSKNISPHILNNIQSPKAEDIKSIKKLAEYLIHNYNIPPEMISNIISSSYSQISKTDKIIEVLDELEIDDKTITLMSKSAFGNIEKTKELVNYLKEDSINKSILKILTSPAYNKPKETRELLKYIIDENINIEYMHNLVEKAFDSTEKTKKIIKYFDENEIEPGILLRIPFDSYENVSDLKGVINYLKRENISLDVLRYLPNVGIKELNKHHENIKYMVSLVGESYEKLKTYPSEMFIWDLEIMDKTIELYNSNIAKSVFGIDNPKLVAAIIYANNVMTEYDKTKDKNIDKKKIQKIYFKAMKDTIQHDYNNILKKYKNGELSYREAVKEIDNDDNGTLIRENFGSVIGKDFLEKLRNASAHLRFEPVVENNKNINDNFIKIYDQDNDGYLNYGLKMTIKDFVDVVHSVEEGLHKETPKTGKRK